MKPGTTVTVATIAVCALLASVTSAQTALHTYRVGFDLDNTPATGCDMAVDEAGYGGGPIPGIELILDLVVDTGLDPPMIVGTAVEECSGASFLPPLVIDDVDRPIGLNTGAGGADVVDGVLPGGYLIGSPAIGLAFASLTESGGEDLVLDNGSVIILELLLGEIPTLSEWGFLFFGLLLAAVALTMLRRRSTAVTAIAVAVLIGAAGVVFAVMASDPIGDSTSGEPAADISGVEAITVGPDIAVSFDIVELENAGPVALDDSVTTDQETVLNGDVFADNGNGVDFDPDGDPFWVTEVNGNAANVGVQFALASGALLTVNANGTFSYDPNGQFDSLGSGESANDTFTYTIDDGSGKPDSATVTVTVTGVNDLPVGGADSFEAVGNTLLLVDRPATGDPEIRVTTGSGFGVLDNDSDPGEGSPVSVAGVVGCGDITTPFSNCATANGGSVTMQSTGQFSFVAVAGDAAASDSFQYLLSDGSSTVPVTVTVNRVNRVWYVANDNASGTDDGTSADPFDTLTEAAAASVAGDTIFVFTGDGTATGQSSGFTALGNQRLLGEGVDLTVPDTLNGVAAPTLFDSAANTHPAIGNTAGAGVTVTDVTGVEVRGLDITGSTIGIDVNVTAGALALTVTDNIISGTTGGHGVDVVSSGTADLELVFDRNSVVSGDTAVTPSFFGASLVGSSFSGGSGTLTISSFSDLLVPDGTSAVGAGISVSNAIFDADPATGGIQQVAGGALTIGDSVGTNRAMGEGLSMTTVRGSLGITSLDIFNTGGPGFGVDNIANPSAADFTLTVAGGAVDTTNAPAINIRKVATGGGGINLTSAVVLNTGSEPGISLDTMTGSVVIGGGSITGAGGSAFRVLQGSAGVTFDGDITNTAGRSIEVTGNTGGAMAFNGAIDDDGTGIFLNSNTGATVNFTGGVDLATTTNNAFTATGGGTVSITGINTVTTTTGSGVTISNTTIGASGLTFESVSVNGATSGIILNNTGTAGGLTVTGDGTGVVNASGGTIQNTTGDGISLTNTRAVSITQLNITASGDHGIDISTVTNFTYQDAVLASAGNADDEHSIRIVNLFGTSLIEDVTFNNINEDGVEILNNSADDGTVDSLTIRRIAINNHDPGFGEHGIDIRSEGTANLSVLVDNSDFDINANGSLGVNGASAGSSTLAVTVQNSRFPAADAFGSGTVQLVAASTSTATFNLVGNSFTGSKFTSVIVNNDDDATLVATIQTNTINASGVTNNGFGIQARQDGNGSFTALIDTNNISNTGFDGIRLLARDTTDWTGLLNATVSSNTVAMPLALGAGVFLRSDDANTLCANVSGNTASGTNIFPGLDDDIVVEQSLSSSVNITQLAPTAAVDPSELDDANNSATVGTTGTVNFGQPPCPTP